MFLSCSSHSLDMEKVELNNNTMPQNEEKMQEEVVHGNTKQLGGVRTLPFILANEMCDRFASTGYHANIITYLTQVLNLPLVQAANTITNFEGTASFTPLIGAFIADSFTGRFSTIIVGTIIYILGLITITLSTVLPNLRPPPCPDQLNCQVASNMQLWVLYIALLLTSIGIGGIRPCVVPLLADQLDMSKAKIEKRKWNLFNWFYFCTAIASLLALTLVVYIQDNVSWAWGFGIPTIAMGLSLLVFVLGSGLYKKIKPKGSPFVRIAQVVVAAIRKKRGVALDDVAKLYENRELDADISTNGRLLHTDQFKWFDRAAVVTHSDLTEQNQPKPWRLATVHRVEELKTLIRVLPIWAASILLVASHSHLGSFTIQQARSMNRHLGPKFQIPPASMGIFKVLTLLIFLPLYERVFVPVTRNFTRNPVGITCLQRMGIGFFLSIVATIVSALVERKRKEIASYYDLLDTPKAVIPMSVFWLVPQYFLTGLSEVFNSVGHLEFLYDQAPESMRSTATALYWIAIGMGNYTSTLLVSLVHKYTGSTRNWLPDRNLNRGGLDYYYWLMTGVQAVNLVYYVICAMMYTQKPLEVVTEIEITDDVESANRKLVKINDSGDK